jgi:hypothetical protein
MNICLHKKGAQTLHQAFGLTSGFFKKRRGFVFNSKKELSNSDNSTGYS